MGNIPITDKMLGDLRSGSAAKFLVTNKDGSTSFTPERQALHDEIVSKALAGHTRSDDPTYIVMGGGPASGKSSMITAGLIPGANDAVKVNSDSVKEQLPEYNAMIAAGDDAGAAGEVHEESSYVAARIQQASFDNGYDTTLDGCGDSSPGKMDAKIDAAHAEGYKVNAYYATLPTETAIERAGIRAAKNNRVVDSSVITMTHAAVSRVLPVVATHFDTVALYDTTTRSPQLIMDGSGGTITIHNQTAWDTFLAKGSEG